MVPQDRKARVVSQILILALLLTAGATFASGFVDPPPREEIAQKIVTGPDAWDTAAEDVRILAEPTMIDVSALSPYVPDFDPAAALAFKDTGSQASFQVVEEGVPLGAILPEMMLATKDATEIDPLTPARISTGGMLGGSRGSGFLKACGGAGYYIIKVEADPVVNTFNVGPYGTGNGYFGADGSCSRPSNDPFPQIWQPYNYGTAIVTPTTYDSVPFGNSCQFSLARGIGAAIDIKMSGTTVYRSYGTSIDGGAAYQKPVQVSVTDTYTWYIAVHDDGDCVYLENGVAADYALYAVRKPNRSVELAVSPEFDALLQSRNAVADPAAAVQEASQWMSTASTLLQSGVQGVGTGMAYEYLLGQITGDPDLASAALSLMDLYELLTGGNMLGLVMTSWLGNLYDAVAYVQSVEHANKRTAQAYFVSSVSTALSGVGDLLLNSGPLGVIYTDRPDGTMVGFALSSTAMDDWVYTDDGTNWYLANDASWPALHFGSGLAAGSLGVAACCMPAGWTEDELALNGYYSGHFNFWLNYYQLQRPEKAGVGVFLDSASTASLYSTIQLMRFFQRYQFAGTGVSPTTTDYMVSNNAPEVGLLGAMQAIFFVYDLLNSSGDPDAYFTYTSQPSSTADSDGDGLSDADEASWGTNANDPDTDDDGVMDGPEVDLGRSPTTAQSSSYDTDGDGLTDIEELNTYHTNAGLAEPDIDYDGLSNSDEKYYGIDPSDPDTDGDALNDGDEVSTYATNPNDSDHDNDGLTDGDEVFTYFTDPKSTDSDGDGLADNAEVSTYRTDPARADSDGDGNSDYWEINTKDTDGDGLSDWHEANTYSTDPNDTDSDDDGLGDGAEVLTYTTNPNDADSDDDGLNDGAEVLTYFTDPKDADSDDDGLNDGAEVSTYFTDPNDADSDDDGLNDGAEVSTYSTDPNDADTDDDGVSDGDEVAAGTDPLVDESLITAQCATTSIFNQAPGNSYNKATAQVYLPAGMTVYSARVTGQGHNQDTVGYVRTMVVEVNGNPYTVLSWLPNGQTQSYDFTLPAGVLQSGWNEVKAYIHWSNAYYDSGHWVTVNLVLDANCVEASGLGTTNVFTQAPGNTYDKAVKYLHVDPSIAFNTVRLTGQGHNQDSVGYVRVMVVEVNGNAYTVLSWLPNGQTQSFNYTLPAGVLQHGWNEVKAYIHWGNATYDAGHWVTVNVVLE